MQNKKLLEQKVRALVRKQLLEAQNEESKVIQYLSRSTSATVINRYKKLLPNIIKALKIDNKSEYANTDLKLLFDKDNTKDLVLSKPTNTEDSPGEKLIFPQGDIDSETKEKYPGILTQEEIEGFLEKVYKNILGFKVIGKIIRKKPETPSEKPEKKFKIFGMKPIKSFFGLKGGVEATSTENDTPKKASEIIYDQLVGAGLKKEFLEEYFNYMFFALKKLQKINTYVLKRLPTKTKSDPKLSMDIPNIEDAEGDGQADTATDETTDGNDNQSDASQSERDPSTDESLPEVAPQYIKDIKGIVDDFIGFIYDKATINPDEEDTLNELTLETQKSRFVKVFTELFKNSPVMKILQNPNQVLSNVLPNLYDKVKNTELVKQLPGFIDVFKNNKKFKDLAKKAIEDAMLGDDGIKSKYLKHIANKLQSILRERSNKKTEEYIYYNDDNKANKKGKLPSEKMSTFNYGFDDQGGKIVFKIDDQALAEIDIEGGTFIDKIKEVFKKIKYSDEIMYKKSGLSDEDFLDNLGEQYQLKVVVGTRFPLPPKPGKEPEYAEPPKRLITITEITYDSEEDKVTIGTPSVSIFHNNVNWSIASPPDGTTYERITIPGIKYKKAIEQLTVPDKAPIETKKVTSTSPPKSDTARYYLVKKVQKSPQQEQLERLIKPYLKQRLRNKRRAL